MSSKTVLSRLNKVQTARENGAKHRGKNPLVNQANNQANNQHPKPSPLESKVKLYSAAAGAPEKGAQDVSGSTHVEEKKAGRKNGQAGSSAELQARPSTGVGLTQAESLKEVWKRNAKKIEDFIEMKNYTDRKKMLQLFVGSFPRKLTPEEFTTASKFFETGSTDERSVALWSLGVTLGDGELKAEEFELAHHTIE